MEVEIRSINLSSGADRPIADQMITPLGGDQQTRSESQTVSSHFERAFEAIENIFILWSALFDFKFPYLQLSPKSSYLVLQNMKVPCQKCNFFWNQRIKERFFSDFLNGFPPAPLLRRDSSAFTIKGLPCPQSWWTILMEIADLHLPETYFLQHLFTKLI